MASTPADLAARGWWVRSSLPGPATRLQWVGVLSTDFPPGSVVDLPHGPRPPAWQVRVVADGDGDRVHEVEVAAPAAPLLWYVEVPEPDAGPAATTLLAFSDERHPDGTVRTLAEARAEGVTGTEQVAAVRWWPGDGLVHQLYVAEPARRRGIAGKLVQAAYGVQAARGLPELHADGRRTELGEQWRLALPAHVALRFADLTEVAAPMTPVG
ncbi:hypothetical protein GB931_09960 [Modestobacter sp. I12A-02628]|uniref:GNAT family N-acetyltransferase n=1 Tax=Goekera deserti TaxID=2497753 RepID=A0A7K3WBH6_9ACTN|nr:GNAT family N-acetyltransferase [Goekera deserti]MPQ98237.1 hypothetical protein [Goekera deserti]NDI48063.1 hypothetical protein [Goekera deserti]NEL53812.1 GNAT family N-acetyltransferase [Goekera deserti]